jgi:hypothetical protein
MKILERDLIKWLQLWYTSQCDGDWEHGNSVDIDTIDNPGWSISINLENTDLEEKNFQKIKIDRSENDWFICWVNQNRFEGRGGPLNLYEILQNFREWTET